MVLKAPLPFRGQKRNWVKILYRLFSEHRVSDDIIFVDVFGGSGLVSRTIKDIYPNNRVIYNDFDGYSERLNNIDKTRQLHKFCLNLFKGVESKSNAGYLKTDLLHHLETLDYVDFVTLSSWVLFSGRYVNNLFELSKETLYNRVPLRFNPDWVNYLKGLEITNVDYKETMSTFNGSNVLYLLDPPYLATDMAGYGDDVWGLDIEFELLKRLSNHKYLLWTSGNNLTKYINDFVLDLTGQSVLGDYKFKSLMTLLNGRKQYDYLYYNLNA